MTLFEKVKLALRIVNTAYDAEIQTLIDSCKLDLTLAGVDSSYLVAPDAILEHAIILYCKANFGYEENADRFSSAYKYLKISLSLSVDYKTIEVVE